MKAKPTQWVTLFILFYSSGPKVFRGLLLYGAPKTCSADLSGKSVSNQLHAHIVNPKRQGHSCSKLFLPFISNREGEKSAHLCTFRCNFSEGKRVRQIAEAGAGRWQRRSIAEVFCCCWVSLWFCSQNQGFVGPWRHLCWVLFAKWIRSRWCGHKLCQKKKKNSPETLQQLWNAF